MVVPGKYRKHGVIHLDDHCRDTECVSALKNCVSFQRITVGKINPKTGPNPCGLAQYIRDGHQGLTAGYSNFQVMNMPETAGNQPDITLDCFLQTSHADA